VLNEADAGMKIADLCRKHGISDTTFPGGVRISVFKASGTITRKVERTDLHKG
jgi:hypothetical protein